MAQYDVDLVVIGGGPGGYPAAIHAAKMGAKVVCIDFDNAGGTCLNWGCIPTKTMIGSVAALEQARHAADFGLTISGEVGFDFGAVMARKDKVVKTLVGGVEFLFKKYKVRFIKGKGKLLDPHTVEATTEDGKTEKVTAANIIIATGSVPSHVPIPGLDGGGADSDVFVDNREVRKRKAAGTLGTDGPVDQQRSRVRAGSPQAAGDHRRRRHRLRVCLRLSRAGRGCHCRGVPARTSCTGRKTRRRLTRRFPANCRSCSSSRASSSCCRPKWSPWTCRARS